VLISEIFMSPNCRFCTLLLWRNN